MNQRVLLVVVAIPGLAIFALNLLTILVNEEPGSVGIFGWVYSAVSIYLCYLGLSGKKPGFFSEEQN